MYKNPYMYPKSQNYSIKQGWYSSDFTQEQTEGQRGKMAHLRKQIWMTKSTLSPLSSVVTLENRKD